MCASTKTEVPAARQTYTSQLPICEVLLSSPFEREFWATRTGAEKTPRKEISPYGSRYITMPAKNQEQEQELLEWIGRVLGETMPANVPFENQLKDGVVLCNLINKISPGSVKKIQTKGTNFQLMENIQRFQAAIKKYGVPEEEIFQTADLFERRNIPQVVLCLYALARITQKHPEYEGPRLGPKMAEVNKREFSEDQLRASEGHLNLQMGYNKGASQSGLGSFGNTRHM